MTLVLALHMRPLLVLEDTIDYHSSMLDSTENPFEVAHDFIFHNTMSIMFMKQCDPCQKVLLELVIQLKKTILSKSQVPTTKQNLFE